MLERIRRFFTLEEDEYYDDMDMVPAQSAVSEKEQKLDFETRKKGGKLLSLVPSKKPCVLVLEPTSYAEAIQIAEQLKRKTPILLNMAKSDAELARRIIDFLFGINYAQDGHMVNVTDQIYLFTPSTIEIRFPGRRDTMKRENFPA
ncbi:MAG: cell division protein SepF [Candidatus Eremiobacteraeota bacterium]|nr:cell division protein SepF [Candidatus Eremiobacteraeota bacterium]